VRRPLAAILLIAVVACTGGGGGGGKVLDDTYQRFDGTEGSFKDFRGTPMVINFFSSTCVPCQTEMPAFEQVHRQLGDQVVFLGMNVQDTVEGGKAFADSVGITWHLGRDPTAAILQGEFGGVGLPTTVLVDRDGRVAFKKLGVFDEGAEGLLKQLRDHHLIS
jgi:thiol-disulfide isomerase/thioredoxin